MNAKAECAVGGEAPFPNSVQTKVLECVDGRQPPSKAPAGLLPWACRGEGRRPSRETGGQSDPHRRLACRKIWSVEKLERLPAGIIPSIAWRREAWKEDALGDLPWKDERGPSSVRRTLEPFQRQRWGNFSERRGGAHMGFSERIDNILNWTEL